MNATTYWLQSRFLGKHVRKLSRIQDLVVYFRKWKKNMKRSSREGISTLMHSITHFPLIAFSEENNFKNSIELLVILKERKKHFDVWLSPNHSNFAQKIARLWLLPALDPPVDLFPLPKCHKNCQTRYVQYAVCILHFSEKKNVITGYFLHQLLFLT